jgi:hypothetical protein
LIHALCLGDFVTVLKSPLNVALLRSVEGILTDDEIRTLFSPSTSLYLQS